jgi:flagellar hook-length control protein FliK
MAKGVETQMGALLRADTVAPRSPRSAGQEPAGASFSSVLDSQNRTPQAAAAERSESGKRLPPRQGDAADAAPGAARERASVVPAEEGSSEAGATDAGTPGDAAESASQPAAAASAGPSIARSGGSSPDTRSGAVLSAAAVGEGRLSPTGAPGAGEAASIAPGALEESASARGRPSTTGPGVGAASAGDDAVPEEAVAARSTARNSDGELPGAPRGPMLTPGGAVSPDRAAAAALSGGIAQPADGGKELAAPRPGVVPAAPTGPDGLRRTPGGSAQAVVPAPGITQNPEKPAPGSRTPGDLAAAIAGSDVEPGRGESDRGVPAPSATPRGLSPTPEAPTGFSATGGAVAVSPNSGTGGALNGATPSSHDLLLRHAPADPEFGPEVAARMQTLIRDGVREARLQLHPAELGRLQVTVSTEGDQARVMFLADTAAARDAIEQALPRLREALQQAGLQLAQSDVGQRQFAGGEDAGDGAPRQGFAGSGVQDADRDAGTDPARMPPPGSVHDGRIDTFI